MPKNRPSYHEVLELLEKYEAQFTNEQALSKMASSLGMKKETLQELYKNAKNELELIKISPELEAKHPYSATNILMNLIRKYQFQLEKEKFITLLQSLFMQQQKLIALLKELEKEKSLTTPQQEINNQEDPTEKLNQAELLKKQKEYEERIAALNTEIEGLQVALGGSEKKIEQHEQTILEQQRGRLEQSAESIRGYFEKAVNKAKEMGFLEQFPIDKVEMTYQQKDDSVAMKMLKDFNNVTVDHADLMARNKEQIASLSIAQALSTSDKNKFSDRGMFHTHLALESARKQIASIETKAEEIIKNAEKLKEIKQNPNYPENLNPGEKAELSKLNNFFGGADPAKEAAIAQAVLNNIMAYHTAQAAQHSQIKIVFNELHTERDNQQKILGSAVQCAKELSRLLENPPKLQEVAVQKTRALPVKSLEEEEKKQEQENTLNPNTNPTLKMGPGKIK